MPKGTTHKAYEIFGSVSREDGPELQRISEEKIMSTTQVAALRPIVGLDQLCINTIRTLSIDAVQQAKSGHPGTPMGLAPLVYTL